MRRLKWLRFSFASLLLALTILAGWLGTLANRARNQRIAVGAITRAGGYVSYDVEEAEEYWAKPAVIRGSLPVRAGILSPSDLSRRSFWRSVLGKHYVDKVISFGFLESEKRVANWTHARKLADGKISDGSEFGDDPALPYPTPSTREWQAISRLRDVTSVYLSFMFSDREFSHVCRLQNLTQLTVRTTDVTDRGFRHIIDATKLERLRVAAPTSITNGSLPSIRRLTNLQDLELGGIGVTDKDVIHFLSLAKLEHLSGVEFDLSDSGVEMLRRLPELRELNLRNNTRLTDESCRHIASLQKLRELDLLGTPISDDGLKHLERLPKLRKLNVADTEVTQDGVKRFSLAVPSCNVYHY